MYFCATSASFSLKITTRCHSVRSLRSPVWRSRQLSDVATDMFTIDLPSCMDLTSGSRPRLPTRMTLFTLPAMGASFAFPVPAGRRHLPHDGQRTADRLWAATYFGLQSAHSPADS